MFPSISSLNMLLFLSQGTFESPKLNFNMLKNAHPLIPPACQMENKAVVFKHWTQYESLHLPGCIPSYQTLFPDFLPISQSNSLFWEPRWLSPAPYFGIPFTTLTHCSSSALYLFVKKYCRDLCFRIMKDASLHSQYHYKSEWGWYSLKDSSLLSTQHKCVVQCRVSVKKKSGFLILTKWKVLNIREMNKRADGKICMFSTSKTCL